MAWFGLYVLSLQPSQALEAQCPVKANVAAPPVALTVPLAPHLVTGLWTWSPQAKERWKGGQALGSRQKNHPNSITSQHQGNPGLLGASGSEGSSFGMAKGSELQSWDVSL